tara:strand:- start:275 stop:490 length:216 start_codon:yes stop_codon:yes gene_type:complete
VPKFDRRDALSRTGHSATQTHTKTTNGKGKRKRERDINQERLSVEQKKNSSFFVLRDKAWSIIIIVQFDKE